MLENGLSEEYKKITVIGAGVTGRAVVDFLSGGNIEIFVTEQGTIGSEARDLFRKRGVKYEEGGHTSEALDSDLIVVSPGVPPDHDLLRDARNSGLDTISEIELAYRLSPTEKIIAVTGTNGKSTTVKLIKEILKSGGFQSVACGNIGTPFISVISSLNPSDVAVVEVSSYQLQAIESFKPKVALLINLEPDHLSRHGSFEKYRRTKLRIFENQDKSDYALLNEGLDLKIPNPKPNIIKFEPKAPRQLRLLPYQKENVGAAITAANFVFEDKVFESPPEDPVKQGLKLPHRLESVAKINGIEFYDDSKATNPAATLAAIEGLEGPIHLLLGGKAKESGYEKLVRGVERSPVRAMYLFGSAEKRLATLFAKRGVENFSTCGNLEKAVREAASNSSPGEKVLLSPGCSSFDRFSNFEERGERFTEIVKSSIINN